MQQARQWLQQARRVAVLTGAGVSAESGIPTFRGAGGLWREYRAEDLATPEAFARDPRLVWEWYDWRRGLIAAAEPNAAHLALHSIEDRAAHFTLVTQNVDGLHARAGSRNIVYLHGDIWTLRCTGCGKSERNLASKLDPLPPVCAGCGAIQRPGVVWFGEGLPQDEWQKADQAVRTSQLLLVVGTSAMVMPAGGLVFVAKQAGARVVEINAEETRMSPIVDRTLRGAAGAILPALLDGMDARNQ